MTAASDFLASPRLRAPAVVLFGLVAFLTVPGSPASGAGPTVDNVRCSSTAARTRVVIDLDRETGYSHRPLADPARVVVEIPGGRFAPSVTARDIGDGYVHRIRMNSLRSGRIQIVLDLGRMLDYSIFALEGPDRIVIDVAHQGIAVPLPPGKSPTPSVPPAPAPDPTGSPPPKTHEQKAVPREARTTPYVVAIDAGHGGEDPGASHHGSREKEITLNLARELAHQLQERPGIQAVLVRKGDYFIPLRKRWDLAERIKADLFVSLHCNASDDPNAQGTEVYFLSLKGATSSAARELARRENEVDEKMGVVPESEVLAGIVNDMIQTDVMSKSEFLAETCLSQLIGLGTVYERGVKQAGFEVLKSPRIPSILVEAAFISNRREHKLLQDRGWQRLFGRKLADGVEAYLKDVTRAEE